MANQPQDNIKTLVYDVRHRVMETESNVRDIHEAITEVHTEVFGFFDGQHNLHVNSMRQVNEMTSRRVEAISNEVFGPFNDDTGEHDTSMRDLLMQILASQKATEQRLSKIEERLTNLDKQR